MNPPTPEQAKFVILQTTSNMTAALTAMKTQADIATQMDERPGVRAGIDLCIETVRLFEAEVDKHAAAASGTLQVYLLTLPVITDEPDAIERDEAAGKTWANPYSWPGDWTLHDNKDTQVVNAYSEDEARQIAADVDCAIWLDSDYARCGIVTASGSGAILARGGEAENE